MLKNNVKNYLKINLISVVAKNKSIFQFKKLSVYCAKNFSSNLPTENSQNKFENLENINNPSLYENKSKEAYELIKVLNTKFDEIDVENLIKTLLLCGHFKNYPREILP